MRGDILAAVHRLAVTALATALAFFTLAYDRLQARTGVYTLWDPEMFYMLNSLLPFKGQSYTFIDHPGTPVEMIGTVVLALLWPVAAARSESLAEMCVREPWIFLTATHVVLTAASIAVVVLMARRTVVIRRWDDVAFALAVACSFYALHPRALQTLAYWSHNSFNLPAGGLLALVLLLRLREGGIPGRRWLVGAGLAAGALTAVQLYMGAWIIGIAVAVLAAAVMGGLGWRHGLRSAFVVGAAAVAGFVLSTLPIAPLYPTFIEWISKLVIHQGSYGSGPPGLSLGTLAANGATVVNDHRDVFAAVGVAILAIAAAAVRDRRSRREHAGEFAIALGLALQCVVLTLAIFKHPGSFYVLSLAALVPVLSAIAFSCWRARGGRPVRVACMLFAAAILFRFVGSYTHRLRTQCNMPIAAARALERVEGFFTQRVTVEGTPPLRVWTTGTDHPCFALWLPNVNTRRLFSPEIARRCPEDGLAWYHLLEYPEAWRHLDPGTPAVLVTVEQELEAEPMLRWGQPVRTNIPSLFQGRFLIIPFPLGRLPGDGSV
jgi:hypothetical protein